MHRFVEYDFLYLSRAAYAQICWITFQPLLHIPHGALSCHCCRCQCYYHPSLPTDPNCWFWPRLVLIWIFSILVYSVWPVSSKQACLKCVCVCVCVYKRERPHSPSVYRSTITLCADKGEGSGPGDERKTAGGVGGRLDGLGAEYLLWHLLALAHPGNYLETGHCAEQPRESIPPHSSSPCPCLF